MDEASKARWGKPTDAYKASLHKAKRADYEKLVRLAIQAMIENQDTVEVAFGYTAKFGNGFPRGLVMRREGLKNIHKIQTRKLLAWLYKHGHTNISSETIRIQKITFTLWEKRLETDFMKEH